MESIEQKILIAGWGRSGTTAIMSILTELGFDTGFKSNDIQKVLTLKGKAGLERRDGKGAYIIKIPLLDMSIFDKFIIDHVLIPIRKIEDAVKSRERIGGTGKEDGGFFHCKNYGEQLKYNAENMGTMISILVDREIPFTFIRFPHFIENPKYLYECLKNAIPEIFSCKNEFFEVFDRIINPFLVHTFE